MNIPFENGNVDLLNNFAVIVNGGSGCLVQSEDRDYSYVLTAKHVLDGKDTIRITRQTFHEDRSVKNEDFKVIDKVYTHISEADKCKDAAIIKIPKVEGIDLVVSEDYSNGTLNECYLCGHAALRREDEYSFRIEILTLLNKREYGYIEAEIKPIARKSEINGQSGGGIISVAQSCYKLVGIQSQMASCEDEVLGRIKLMPVSFFKEIIEEHSLAPFQYTSNSGAAFSEKNFSLIPVNRKDKILNTEDIYCYDLLTLLSIERGFSVVIFGHEPTYLVDLTGEMNRIEKNLVDKQKKFINTSGKEWLSVLVTNNNLREILESVSQKVSKKSAKEIGIILVLDIEVLNNNHTLISSIVSNLYTNYSQRIKTIFIDYPSRNIVRLREIQNSLKENKNSKIYVSTVVEFNESQVNTGISFFDTESDFGNIYYLLSNVLENQQADDLKDKCKFKYFDKIKIELSESRNGNIIAFSPIKLIAEFENRLSTDENDYWKGFYKELLLICNKHLPEFIERVIYYSARSSNEIIRYESLKFSRDNSDLIDYWVEGTKCEEIFFRNILSYIPDACSFLVFPILRFYNRNKNKSFPNFKEQVRCIITDEMNGKLFRDFWIVEVILNENPSYPLELLIKNNGSVMKLIECGVNVFTEVDNAILEEGIINQNLFVKAILSTQMTNEKIEIIFKRHRNLINY